MQFAILRLIVISLSVFAQVYLFVRIRRVIRSLHRSTIFKSRAIGTAAACIFLLFSGQLFIMVKPVPWVYPPTAAQGVLFYPPAVWGLGSIFSALLLLVTEIAGWIGKTLVLGYRKWTGQTTSPSLNLGRRRFLQASVAGIAATPLFISGYGAAYAGRGFMVRTLALPFGQALRVAQLSDIHAGIYMNRNQLRRYAELVKDLKPDLFVMTGDFISNALSFLPGCLEEMLRVRAPYGTFATLGNHEHWYGGVGELEAIFRQYGIPLLINEHRVIRSRQGQFAVAGIDDLMAGRPDLAGALRGLAPAVPTLLLSHRPEIFPQAAAQGIQLTLAGHYHGGQIKLSLLGGDISLAHMRTPYPEGLYRINASHLYVNRGIGTTFTPVRLNCPPEITLFNLT